jgi:ferric-dicitrate binding protein FerR (iron transport regulator)
MSAADCDRWIELADQSAAGEHLTDNDQGWLSQHARVCRDCGAERQFYTSLGDALGRPEVLVIPSQGNPSPTRRVSSRRALSVGLALAASVAIAAAGYRVLRGSRPVSSQPSPVIAAQVLLASGEARLGLAAAEAGQRISQGERLSTDSGLACMGIADSVELCLDGASAAIFALGDPNQIVVYLEKGTLMARLEHQPSGRKFFVRTPGAELQAVGTRFSVHLAEDGSTRVRLHEGKLAVRAASRISTDLAAPVQASITQDIQVAPISSAATGEDKPLVDLVDAARWGPRSSLTINSTPSGANVLLDNVAIGKTPLSMFLAEAAHVSLSLEGYAPFTRWIEVGDQPHIERTFALTALAASPPEPSEKPGHIRHAVSRVSPDQLLAKAQSLRARGQYRSCAQLYHRLWSEFPGSEEAKVSMISLGELELLHTRNAVAALDAFNTYLRLGGALEREARFGKIRALRALDRSSEADAETTRFLHDYPTGAQAATLRRESHGE